MEKIMNIRDAIKTAIQMEKDGYSFYIKAAAQTTNKMGKEIFESLASDEQVHLDVFKKLFDDTIGNKEWENLVFSSKKYADIPIFPKDLKSIEGASPNTNDLDALRIAMDAEKEAIDYYSEMLICEKNEVESDMETPLKW